MTLDPASKPSCEAPERLQRNLTCCYCVQIRPSLDNESVMRYFIMLNNCDNSLRKSGQLNKMFNSEFDYPPMATL